MIDPNTPPAPARKRRGCLFYGCLTLCVLFVIASLLIVVSVRWVKHQIDAYTDTAPVSLPKVEMPEAEFKALNQRVEAFGDALDKGKATEPLTLTEQEVNALLTGKPEMKEIADKVHVTLKDNHVQGQISIPLKGLGWGMNGRYLNGQATFKVSLHDGTLGVYAEEVTVKGRPLPEKFMEALRNINLAEDAENDPETAKIIGKLESIEIQSGRAIIKARPPK